MVQFILQLRKSLLQGQKRRNNPYQELPKEELILRDFLATDRTMLANERTFLAYIRTSITFFLAGISINHIFNTPFMQVVGFALVIVSAIVFAHGFNTYRKVKETISFVKDKTVISVEANTLEDVTLPN